MTKYILIYMIKKDKGLRSFSEQLYTMDTNKQRHKFVIIELKVGVINKFKGKNLMFSRRIKFV